MSNDHSHKRHLQRIRERIKVERARWRHHKRAYDRRLSSYIDDRAGSRKRPSVREQTELENMRRTLRDEKEKLDEEVRLL